MKDRRDVRTLCYKCASDMHNAGIKMHRTGGERGTCDKCDYYKTSNYIVK